MKILIISGGSIDEMWGRKWVADYEPDYCIAADSGLVMADKLGLTVDLLLGDYDSVDKKIFEKYNGNTKTITYPCEKDYTDTHLALKKAIEKIKKLQDCRILSIKRHTWTYSQHRLKHIHIDRVLIIS